VPALTAHSLITHPVPVTHATPFVNSLRNMEGDVVAAIVIGSILLSTPLRVTVTFTAIPGEVSHGTWKLIWVGETNVSGAFTPLTLTLTPATDVGKFGAPETWYVPSARLSPYTVVKLPGAMVPR
jgi:hypothetical protein